MPVTTPSFARMAALAARSLWRAVHRPAALGEKLARGLRLLREQGTAALARRLLAAEAARDRERGYAAWIELHDTLDDPARAAIRDRVARLEVRPRFSIVMPVYDTDERWLRRAIESALGQLYSDWELCIADDRSRRPHVAAVLREYAARDARVRVVFRDRNGHISAASNSALALATGDFVVLLDHDDELAEHALSCLAEEIAAHPGATLLYSDEDKIDAAGRRFDPYFKPDWNPDLFLSQNLVSHVGAYRRDVLAAIGGFREGYEGSQDHDLALRFVEHAGEGGIRHVPRVLYHWRAVPGSTARAARAKAYAAGAARRAVADYLARRGVTATVEPAPGTEGYLRVRYHLPAPPPLVSVIIPTHDRAALLERCVATLREKTEHIAFELLIVDNGSEDPAARALLAALACEQRVRVLRDLRPFNFSALNNAAARQARGAVLVFLNDDVEVIAPGWLAELVGHAMRPEVGPVGAMLYYPNDTIQHAGVLLGVGGVANHAHRHLPRGLPGYFGRAALIQSFSAVTAACMAVRRDVFAALGGFDEELAMAYNDVDFCLRAGARGWRTVWTPYAELYHHESATRGSDVSGPAAARREREATVLRERWGAIIDADPAYNPNLTLEREDFALAAPPRGRTASRRAGAHGDARSRGR